MQPTHNPLLAFDATQFAGNPDSEPNASPPQFISSDQLKENEPQQHNPFYLLSGLSMFVGCAMVYSQIHGENEFIWRLVTLLAIFEVYSLVVLGLGLFLLHRTNQLRDTGYLLVLTSMLFVDVMLLYNELFTSNLAFGVGINCTAAVLAVGKFHLIARAVHLRFNNMTKIVISLELAVIYIMPGLFAVLRKEEMLDTQWIYLGWWVVALIVMLHTGPWIGSYDEQAFMPSGESMHGAVRIALIYLPVASVVEHMWAVNYIHEQPFYWCNLSPMLLATAWIWLHQIAPVYLDRVTQVMAISLVAVAGLLSLDFPQFMLWSFSSSVVADMSPMRITLIASAAMCVYAWFLHGGLWVLGGAAINLGIVVAGATPHRAGRAFTRLGNTALALIRDNIPRTILAWGMIVILLAFILLGFGAWRSLGARKRLRH